MARKRLVSGIQPSGQLHIGNYFGALRQFVELQNKYECFFFIVDYHALTTVQDSKTLRENTLNTFIDFLAIGLDPEKAVIYKQSDVPEVTELTWIFNTLTTMPYLERAHAFKDRVAKGITPSVGLFDYPVLMAADILLPNADLVPVGEDQRQHLEMAREIARKFNGAFGETFKEPEEVIRDEVATVPGLDGQKMSKSYGNTIPLFANDNEIEKLVMSIVTDSKDKGEALDPETDTVFALHKLFATEDELKDLGAQYESGSVGYKESKELLRDRIIAFITPLRERRSQIASDKARVLDLLTKGGEKAREAVVPMMEEVRNKVGLTIENEQ